jgi:hypothetical protein
MARVGGTMPWALKFAKEQKSARAFIREMRKLGIGARDSEMRSIYKVAQDIVARSNTEPFLPLNRKPRYNTLPTWGTKFATGVRQNVQLVYRNKTTGELTSTFWSVHSDRGITRQEAISRAISEYNSELQSALHVSAFRLSPSGF